MIADCECFHNFGLWKKGAKKTHIRARAAQICQQCWIRNSIWGDLPHRSQSGPVLQTDRIVRVSDLIAVFLRRRRSFLIVVCSSSLPVPGSIIVNGLQIPRQLLLTSPKPNKIQCETLFSGHGKSVNPWIKISHQTQCGVIPTVYSMVTLGQTVSFSTLDRILWMSPTPPSM